MLKALEHLNKSVPVSFIYEENLKSFMRKEMIEHLWENQDFSPFAKERQKKYKDMCQSLKITYHLCDSITLLPMGTFVKKKAYVKFTPFYTYARRFKVPEPIKPEHLNKIVKATSSVSLAEFRRVPVEFNIKKLAGWNSKGYEWNRNHLSEHTSGLGPYIHFGVYSIRSIYHQVKNVDFRKQLYWREFYMYVVNYVAVSYEKKSWTLPRFNKVKWRYSEADFKKWCDGKTGVPIVDAGMRQLQKSGFLHNRARMVCAMYLIHYLHIHWKHGEKWFAQNLVDYSYANNYGGWVWCAGIEVYSNPYYRVFSMEQQQKRFDSDFVYVREWCPEHRKKSDVEILNLYKPALSLKRQEGIDLLRKV
jgi:deoxyribodipyrimidine photo-lyase